MEPRVHRFTGGWSVTDGSCATFASTREEALKRFERLVSSRTCWAAECADDAAVVLDGVALCTTHYHNVTSRTAAGPSPDRMRREMLRDEPVRRSESRQASAR